MKICQRKFKCFIYSPGCRSNQSDGEGLAFLLKEDGFFRVFDIKEADFLIISGCVVTRNAEKDVEKLILKAKKVNPNIKVVITGCLAERLIQNPISSISYDFILPMGFRNFISSFLKGKELDFSLKSEEIFFVPSLQMEKKSRYYFKIQEGCDGNCSYCYVRFVRGKPRSLPLKKVLEHMNNIIDFGVKEIVFCGTHLGSYGKDLGYSLGELVLRINEIKGEFRFRFSSIEPWDLKDELIDVLKDSTRFCHYFHLPLQSGSDKVLKLMARPYNKKFYSNLIFKLKDFFNYARIGCDVMVGFPEEDKKDFEETLNFIKEIPVDYLHIFTYSPRPNHSIPLKISKEEVKERYKILKELDLKKREEDKKKRAGIKTELLSINKNIGILRENYYCHFEEFVKPSLLFQCKIVKWNGDKAFVKLI